MKLRTNSALFGVFGTLVLFALRWFQPPEFWITLANYIGIYSLVAMGLVLLTGISGMTSFGQAAFVGIGAYASAYLTTVLGLSPWLGLLLGVVITVFTAYCLGLITLGLSGHYLPLCTIAWGISLFYLFGNMEFLGKFDGITGIPPIDIFGYSLISGSDSFILIWISVLWASIGLNNILQSRTGRAIRALKGGILMAESCGVSTMQYKLLVFVMAAVLAGVSGWLYAHLQRAVNPTPFNLTAGIGYLIMAVVGGVGYLWGAVLGAIFITLLNNWLQNILPSILGQSGNYEVVVSGVLLIFLLQKYPSGVLSWFIHKAEFAKSYFYPSTIKELDTIDPIELDSAKPLSHLSSKNCPLRGAPLLSVNNIHKSYGGLKALNGVSFKMSAGQIVGLIGPNGAGKSTLFNVISGVVQTSSGSVEYMGREVQALPARKRAILGMARSFQHVRLIANMSVLDNVLIGAHMRGGSSWVDAVFGANKKEEVLLQRLAMQCLDQVGLAHCSGLDANSLSLGQQRLLEIARALASDPNLLLLDEPAAGLRHLEKQQLQTALLGLSRGKGISILIVEHDMDFVMGLVDELVVMDFGNPIATGLPNEVRNNPRVIQAYLGLQD